VGESSVHLSMHSSVCFLYTQRTPLWRVSVVVLFIYAHSITYPYSHLHTTRILSRTQIVDQAPARIWGVSQRGPDQAKHLRHVLCVCVVCVCVYATTGICIYQHTQYQRRNGHHHGPRPKSQEVITV
jgi:hypothetical protein